MKIEMILILISIFLHRMQLRKLKHFPLSRAMTSIPRTVLIPDQGGQVERKLTFLLSDGISFLVKPYIISYVKISLDSAQKVNLTLRHNECTKNVIANERSE